MVEHSGWVIDTAHGLQIVISCINPSTNRSVKSKTAREPSNIERHIRIYTNDKG